MCENSWVPVSSSSLARYLGWVELTTAEGTSYSIDTAWPLRILIFRVSALLTPPDDGVGLRKSTLLETRVLEPWFMYGPGLAVREKKDSA